MSTVAAIETTDPSANEQATSKSSGGREGRRLILLVTALLVVGLAILSVLAVFALITPINRPASDLTIRQTEATTTDLSVFTRFDPFVGNAPSVAPVVVESANETQLNLKLFGTYVGEPASAIVQGENGRQAIYFVDDEIASGVSIREIRSDQILLDRRGVLETLSLENRERPVGASSYGNGVIGSAANSVSNTFAGLSTYIQVRPATDGNGFLLYAGDEPQLFNATGLINGDKLLSIDGVGLTAGGAALANLPSRLQSGPVEILVERDGIPIELEIDLTGLTP